MTSENQNLEGQDTTVAKCREILIEMDPQWDHHDPGFRAAMILLFGTLNGKFTVIQLVESLEYDRKEVADIVRNIKKEKMWVQNTNAKTRKEFPTQVQISDWFGESGGISFLLDVNRAQGYITAV